MKKIFLCLLIVSMIAVFSLTGCKAEAVEEVKEEEAVEEEVIEVIEGEETVGEAEEVEEAEEIVEETTTPPSDESLSDVLAKVAGIGSVKYDIVMSIPGEPTVTTTIWMKGNNMRMEMTVEGQTMIMIMNGDKQEAYTYFPDENMAMKIDFSQATESATEKSATEEVGSIVDYNPTVIGTESIDGKLCMVVEYVTPDGTAKMWIWLEHGFPVRMEMATPDGTLRADWRNIEFVDIPDNMFELPAGVEIMDVLGGIPGMPEGAW